MQRIGIAIIRRYQTGKSARQVVIIDLPAKRISTEHGQTEVTIAESIVEAACEFWIGITCWCIVCIIQYTISILVFPDRISASERIAIKIEYGACERVKGYILVGFINTRCLEQEVFIDGMALSEQVTGGTLVNNNIPAAIGQRRDHI